MDSKECYDSIEAVHEDHAAQDSRACHQGRAPISPTNKAFTKPGTCQSRNGTAAVKPRLRAACRVLLRCFRSQTSFVIDHNQSCGVIAAGYAGAPAEARQKLR
eukprot:5585282-Pleurochrysis_carterae.AAC.1